MAYYNRLRDLLRNETSLPEDLSWESMQAGIYDKMGQKKKKRRLLILWLLPIFICGSIGMFLYLGEVDKIIVPIENDKQNNIIALSNPAPSSSITKEKLANNPSTNTSANEFKNSPSNAIPHTYQPIVSKVSNQSINTNNLEKEQLIPLVNPSTLTELTSIPKNEQTNILSTSIDIVAPENKIANKGYLDLINPNASNPYVVIEPLTLIFNNELNSLSYSSQPMSEVSPTLPAKNNKNTHLGSMDLMVNAGTSFWNIGKPTILQLASEQHKAMVSEKGLPGFSVAIRHDISINKPFFVTTMIDYQRLYAIFSYDGTKNTPKELDNIIISIHDNLISGEKTFIRGTASVKEAVTRKLQHRNEMVRSSLSLLPGFQHSSRNWAFKVNAGPTIGLFTTGKGKTLWKDEVVTYDGDLPHYNNSLKIGFTSSALVKYYVSQRWFLHSSVLYQKYLTNHSADPTQIIKPSLVNISAGVGYSF